MIETEIHERSMLGSLSGLAVAGLSRLLLWLFGLSWLPSDQLAYLSTQSKAIIVLSHTSYLDFWLWILLKLSHPIDLQDLGFLVRPDVFRGIIGGWFRQMGCIPAVFDAKSKQFSVERVETLLRARPSFLFSLSPKGVLGPRPWQSGYFQLAFKLKVPIMVAGLDYEQKRMVTFPALSLEEPPLEESEIRNRLQIQMGTIVPLYPEQEVIPIRAHNPRNISVISWTRIFFFLYSIVAGLYYLG